MEEKAFHAFSHLLAAWSHLQQCRVRMNHSTLGPRSQGAQSFWRLEFSIRFALQSTSTCFLWGWVRVWPSTWDNVVCGSGQALCCFFTFPLHPGWSCLGCAAHSRPWGQGLQHWHSAAGPSPMYSSIISQLCHRWPINLTKTDFAARRNLCRNSLLPPSLASPSIYHQWLNHFCN